MRVTGSDHRRRGKTTVIPNEKKKTGRMEEKKRQRAVLTVKSTGASCVNPTGGVLEQLATITTAPRCT